MQGLLADVNIEGHLRYIERLLVHLDLSAVLAELNVRLATFRDLGFARDLDDRSLWNRCQVHGWVLLTENRNLEGPDALEATLADSWQLGYFPVLTLANKSRFEQDRDYAQQVAGDIADLLFGIVQGEFCDRPRIYVPV